MIRWITPRLGTSAWGESDINKEYSIVDVRSLRDEGGNPHSLIVNKVNDALMLSNTGLTVIICCDHGMSRSNAIASAVLAKSENISFFEAVNRVIQATGEQQIKVDLLADVEAAISFTDRTDLDTTNFPVVLGGAGFIGHNLITGLETTTSVLTFDNESDLLTNAALLRTAIGNKRNFDLYFLWNPKAWNTNQGVADVIFRLRNVLEVAKLVDARLIWFSGSQIYYGWSGETLLATEDLYPNPANAVGDGLYLCETLINLYRKRHDCSILVIRPTHIYGFGDDRPTFLNSFVNKALDSQLIETHSYINGLPMVDMLHITDFIDGVIASSRESLTGTLHLSSEEWVSTLDLVHFIIEMSKSNSATECVDIEAVYPDVRLVSERAKRELNWYPKTTLEKGLEQLLLPTKNSQQ